MPISTRGNLRQDCNILDVFPWGNTLMCTDKLYKKCCYVTQKNVIKGKKKHKLFQSGTVNYLAHLSSEICIFRLYRTLHELDEFVTQFFSTEALQTNCKAYITVHEICKGISIFYKIFSEADIKGPEPERMLAHSNRQRQRNCVFSISKLGSSTQAFFQIKYPWGQFCCCTWN